MKTRASDGALGGHGGAAALAAPRSSHGLSAADPASCPLSSAKPSPRSSHQFAGNKAESRIDFDAINAAALAALPSLVVRWLPEGRREGAEWVARNPTRPDRRPGSFKINLRTGRWADFATGERGGDPISLAAYLAGIGQGESAGRLGNMLGLPHG